MPEQPDNKTKIKCLKIAIAIACAVFFVLWVLFFFVVKVKGRNGLALLKGFDGLKEVLHPIALGVFVLCFSPPIYLTLILLTLKDNLLPKLLKPIKIIFYVCVVALYSLFILIGMLWLLFIFIDKVDLWEFYILAIGEMLALLIVPCFLLNGLCKQKGIVFIISRRHKRRNKRHQRYEPSAYNEDGYC